MDKAKYSPELFLQQIKTIAEIHRLNFPGGFEKKIGMRGAVSAWEPRDKKGFHKKYSIPSVDTLLKIKNLFNVSVDWLLTGEEPKTREIVRPVVSFAGQYPDKEPDVRSEYFITVPQVEGRIAAKHAKAIPPAEIKSWLCLYLSPRVGRSHYQNLLAVQVADDYHAMEPTIRAKDIVVIDPYDITLSSGDIYAVRLPGGEECDINRVYLSDQRLIIASDNPGYVPRILPPNRAKHIIIGRVLWSWTSWRY